MTVWASRLWRLLATLCVVCWLMPLGWMLWGALVPYEYFIYPTGRLFSITLANFAEALLRKDWQGAFVSSCLVSFATTAIVMVFAVPAAYALARWPKQAMKPALLLLSTHFLPPAVSLIAYVIVFQALDLMDTCTAQVVVGVAAQLGYFCVLLAVNLWPFDSSFEQWLMTQGATAMKAMMHSLWARARQPIARVALLLSLIQWNEYFYALALSGGGKSQTLPVVVSGFITGQDVKWGPMFAGSAMVIVPALLIAWAVERSLLRGFSLGAVR